MKNSNFSMLQMRLICISLLVLVAGAQGYVSRVKYIDLKIGITHLKINSDQQVMMRKKGRVTTI